MKKPALEPYCQQCWFPSSKPNFSLSTDGICRACASAENRTQLSHETWENRAHEFSELVRGAVKSEAPHYDVVVPVSGGKDSITQVVRANLHGARILAVSVDYGVKTNIGRRNLDVVPSIGDRVSLQTYRPPLKVHRQMILKGLREYGDPDLFSHTLLHAYPLHQALALQVPLVVLGENSADVYGGSSEIASLKGMTRRWFENYAVSGDHTVMSTAEDFGIDSNALRYYDFPDLIETSNTRSVFLSSYFPWDSEVNFEIAKEHGFQELESAREGTFKTYVGIDEHINRIHQYLKFLKFGYGRTTDHVCEEIRLGRITREQGKQLILEHELPPPSLDTMQEVSGFLDISVIELAHELERWRNTDLWTVIGPDTFQLRGFLGESASPPVVALSAQHG